MGAFATRYQTATVDGLEVFYREAGDPSNPTSVLLHGFPSSSHMFRNLIAALSDQFHLIAPEIAQKMRQLGAISASLSDDDFADITLYHYGPQSGFHVTVTVLGWSEDRAREFLAAQFAHALSATRV